MAAYLILDTVRRAPRQVAWIALGVFDRWQLLEVRPQRPRERGEGSAGCRVDRFERMEIMPLLGKQARGGPLARRAIDEAFVAGYRVVLKLAAGLALASSMSAALLIGAKTKPARIVP